MYTLVLMSAMAGAPDASGWFGRGYGCGGSACYSSCYGTSCVGASYACYGSCSGCFGGCYGGPLFPRLNALAHGFGDRLRGAFAPLGSYATCYGCTGSACYGSCLGASCFGCSGGVYYGSAVYGGCYGTSCVGCHGCFGGCVGLPVALGHDLPAVPAVSFAAPTAEVVAMKPAGDPAAASLVVSLPAAARLYVDGQLVAGDGPARRFHTPPLAAGQSFYYELKAELLVGGKTEVEETKVVVRAGDSKDVGFPRLLTAAARADASLAAR